jgi:MoaA/NifB/PqqE/SkfB family radical SAM enzyme
VNNGYSQNSIVKEHGNYFVRLFSNLSNGKNLFDEKKYSVVTTSTTEIVPLQAPWRITFDTNPDDCNYSCTMCEQHSEFSPHQKTRKANKIRRRRMDFDIIKQVVSEMAPLGLKEIIPTTMGEPLQYKEFPMIIKLCHEYNVKLNLTTNGSFIGAGVEFWANLIVPVAVDVKFSWNGATEETQKKIMKGSSLNKHVENLKKFISIRDSVANSGGNYCSVTLQMTFMEQNLHEIAAVVALAVEHGCDRVKGHHLWTHFDEIKHENLRRSEESILRWNKVAKQCRDYVLKNKLKNGKTLKLVNFFD